MQEVDFIPMQAKGDDAPFIGKIVLREPTNTERYIIRDTIEVGTSGRVDKESFSWMKIAKLAELSRKHFVSVDITHKESGAKFSSFDELNSDKRCENIITEVAIKLLATFRPQGF